MMGWEIHPDRSVVTPGIRSSRSCSVSAPVEKMSFRSQVKLPVGSAITGASAAAIGAFIVS